MAKKVSKLAKRYAKAFFASIVESGSSESPHDVARFLGEFSELWLTEESLSQGILNPMFPVETRLKALDEIASSAGLPDSVRRFLQVLLERDRLSLIAEIAVAFLELADEKENVVRIELTSAKEVSDQERSQTEELIKGSVSGTPVFSWQSDPSLLGGMRIRFGGKVIDGSLAGKLERAERSIAGESF